VNNTAVTNLKFDVLLILKQSVMSLGVIARVPQSSVLDFKSAGRRRKELTVGVVKKKV
jgi:hypothetical protein